MGASCSNPRTCPAAGAVPGGDALQAPHQEDFAGGWAGMGQGEAEEIGGLAFSRSSESARKLQWKAPSENQSPAQMLLEQEVKALVEKPGSGRVRSHVGPGEPQGVRQEMWRSPW